LKKSIVFFKYGLKTVLGKGGGFDVYIFTENDSPKMVKIDRIRKALD